ncbi:MAG: aspartate-semialdehyde dehydrogenase [Rickettsiaceae bacterium H1]|nr:aspartate-semialdehyde dehydrogenase [Rickettsiaceae bacterium H1]
MKYNIVVVGATGNVGREILQILVERNFPVNETHALANERSVGKSISFGEDQILSIDALEGFNFSETDIAFFSAGSDVSKTYATKATEKGCVVIDNTSHFRMDPDIPLIVPEINISNLIDYKKKYIIANPNCSTIQMLVGLKPLHDLAKIKRIVVSTYQSVSGKGKLAMDELYYQTKNKFMNQEFAPTIFPKQITFNCIPHIDEFLPEGETKEERKMVEETQKILDKDITVSATCVRVPVFVGHAESVNVELEKEITIEEVKKSFESAKGVVLTQRYVTPVDIVKEDAVYVSRFRKDKSIKNGFNMWIVTDNLRKGAALNAVQIAENLINL